MLSKDSIRTVNGIVLVDKPGGATSNRVLQRIKRLFQAKKAGHTGSLDPGATGMLPVCFGSATKISGQLLQARKTYRVTARLGIATDTGDADGQEIERHELVQLDDEPVYEAVESMRGLGSQTPPMYSALKVDGRRLYELAREGKEIERKPRPITVYEITTETVQWPTFEFTVSCSKGTYVRTLVTDIAAKLGTIGHVTSLRRLAVDPYAEMDMVTVDALEMAKEQGIEALDAYLLGADSALIDLPAVTLAAEGSERISHGQRVQLESHAGEGRVRLYDSAAKFLGVGEVDSSGELKPRRLFVA